MFVEAETTGEGRCKKLVQDCLASVKRIRSQMIRKPLDVLEGEANKKRRVKDLFRIQNITRRKAPYAEGNLAMVQSVPVDDSSSSCTPAHIYRAMDSIFTSIIETDTVLQTQTNPPMICFLVHLASDLDTEGSFLSTLHKLPPEATRLDEFASLSYASSRLQFSLDLIRYSCMPGSGPVTLQTPFIVVETEFELARARAMVLQKQYPEKRFAIATLDLVALKEARLVASVERTFDTLRVPMDDVDFSQRLLVWVQDGGNEAVEKALRASVLAVMEWTGEEKGRTVEMGEVTAEDKTSAIEGLKKSRKKDSVVARCTEPGVSEA
ncbi:hypothetical protein OPT61_g8301 [Boeremia exigua]|uniref:Uncharacterized protein n=1 Tax=Boeremia exigua TaxID=749465 RepID=A0ACC2HZ04_9PLEO|nr:hypothetical protein OPT61_g8301 [Boeremia exigua]